MVTKEKNAATRAEKTPTPAPRAHDGNDVADDRNRAGSALGYVQ
jgi:hypothetical protein